MKADNYQQQCCDIISNHFYWTFIVAQDLKGDAGFGGKIK